MQSAVFCDVTPCILIVYRCFEGNNCLIFGVEECAKQSSNNFLCLVCSSTLMMVAICSSEYQLYLYKKWGKVSWYYGNMWICCISPGRRISMEQISNNDSQGGNTQRKNRPSASLSTIHLTRIALVWNSGHQGQKPATKRLSYGPASSNVKKDTA
jgi:hypothetical protein